MRGLQFNSKIIRHIIHKLSFTVLYAMIPVKIKAATSVAQREKKNVTQGQKEQNKAHKNKHTHKIATPIQQHNVIDPIHI